LLHAVEILFGANEKALVADGIGGERPLFEAGIGQLGERGAWLEDNCRSVLALQVDFSVRIQWRSGVRAAEALAPMFTARLGIDARRAALVGVHVQLVVG